MGQRGAARVLGVVGRVLVGAGIVILLFAAYQLWGTGFAEAKAQNRLEDDFAARLAQVGSSGADALNDAARSESTTSGPATTAPGTTEGSPAHTSSTLPQELVDLLYPSEGEPVARIVIPRIGVDKVVVEGTEVEDLRKGPGHFADTPLPGQEGNAAIAGHRTTYGAPFGDIDKLEPGDEIRVSTVLGESIYQVQGTSIVTPDQVEVVDDFGDNRLTLSACHPKFSASQRIIVWASLLGEPNPTLARPEDRRTVDVTPTTAVTTPPAASNATAPVSSEPAPTTTTSTGTIEPTAATTPTSLAADINHLAGDPDAWPGAIAWGFASLLVGALGWFAALVLDRRRGKHAARRWGMYVMTTPLVLSCLFFCFVHVDRLLPAY